MMSMSNQDILFDVLKKSGSFDSDTESFIATQTSEKIEFILSSADPSNISRVLARLDRGSLLTPKYWDLILSHPKPQSLDYNFFYLDKAGIFLPEYLDMVIEHKNPDLLYRALDRLMKSRILTRDNFLTIVNHPSPCYLSEIFCILNKAGILTPENQALASGHPDTVSLFNGLPTLQWHGILTENFHALATHPKPEHIAFALIDLNDAKLLTCYNRELLASSPDPVILGQVLSLLRPCGLLTQSNFIDLLEPHHALLISDYARQNIWPKIPKYSLYQMKFDDLLNAAKDPDPLVAKIRIEEIIMGKTSKPVLNARGIFKPTTGDDSLVKPIGPKIP